jgi:hypothetical protein
VDAIDLPMLTIKSATGETQKVRIPDNARISAMVKASVDDLKPNVFVGVTGIPSADGGEKAYEVHIFPEERRGTGEGRHSWDRGPQSMMTNGAVSLDAKATEADPKLQVEAASSRMLTLTFKGEQAKIALTPETIIAAYAPGGDTSELKPGTQVVIVAGKKGEDLEASAVIYGRNGFVPPI